MKRGCKVKGLFTALTILGIGFILYMIFGLLSPNTSANSRTYFFLIGSAILTLIFFALSRVKYN